MQSLTRLVPTICGWLLAIPIVQAAPATASKPYIASTGDWTPRDVTVRLSYLPRRYSCDELSDRFHDLLLALGAQPEMKILTSECFGGVEAYSPRVHLRFSVPSTPANVPTRVAGADGSSKTLRLAPGHLGSWTRNDCELMRQIKDKLLPQVAPKIVAFSLACAAPPANSEHYSVVVQIIEPAHAPARVAAAANAGPGPAPVGR